MLSRSIAVALAAIIFALPLTANADLWINYKNLRVITAQRGCHLERTSDETKTSVVRCGPYEMTDKPHFITYTEAWGRRTDDPRYGGCSSQAWTIALPPATHQFNISVNNSDRAPIICKYNWQNNNTVDVYFLDKIPAQPARFHVRGVTSSRLSIYGDGGMCGLASSSERTVGECRTSGDLTFAIQKSDGNMTYPCKVKVWPMLAFVVPLWFAEFKSNSGACTLTKVDHFNWNVDIKA